MNIRRPVLYLAIACATAIIVLFVENPDRPRVDDSSLEMFLPGFDSAIVERVEVSQLLDGAALARDGAGWKVAENVTPMKKELYEKEGKTPPVEQWQAADSDRVSNALGGFGGLTRGVIASTNPERRELFGVGATALSVKLFGRDGKTIADLAIGKSGPDFGSTYIRSSDDDKVFLVNRALVGLFSPVASDWVSAKTSAGSQDKKETPLP